MINPLRNWNWIRAFLAVAEHGSLSAAADALGLSQPALSRQIQQLETATGWPLFSRSTTGLQMTAEGTQLLATAQAMGEAADQFQRHLTGQSPALEGDVRISTSELIGQYILAPALVAFQKLWPGVQVDTVLTDRISSLSKGEADLALRMVRPSQPDLVVRQLGQIPLGFYCARSYAEEHGVPQTAGELSQHRLIGPDQDTTYIREAAAMGLDMQRADFSLRSDSLLMQVAYTRAGGGVGVLHQPLAAHWPDLVPVMTDVNLPKLDLWLVCHGDVRHSHRIRTLQQFLIEWFDSGAYERALA